MEILFKTIHGSHLYGLNHAESDEDYYTVVRRPRGRRYKWAKQTIVDGVDSMRVDLPTWLRLCEKGVPQALEAMFSPMAEIDNLPFLRHAYVPGGEVRRTYHRTIEKFIMSGEDDFKRRRHAVRLAFNLHDIMHHGQFNPVLTPYQRSQSYGLAKHFDGQELLGIALDIAYRR